MTNEKLAAVIAENVRRVRSEKDMTQAQLEEATGIAVPHISRLESGKHLPSLATLNSVANALGVHPCELLREPERKPRKPKEKL